VKPYLEKPFTKGLVECLKVAGVQYWGKKKNTLSGLGNGGSPL
jgi:hypothetical protein